MSSGTMDFKCGIFTLIILLSVPGSLGEDEVVTCRAQTICALRESTTYLMCSYSKAIKPQQSFWFSPKQKAKWRNKEDPEDLALDPDYARRVTYNTSSHTFTFISTLTIRDLRERDSGEYQFMIITEKGEKYSSSTTLTLTVSDLQIKKISDKDNERTLNCSTSCSLTSEPSYYFWFRNGQYLNKTGVDKRAWGLYNTDDPGSYSCSISDRPEIRSSSVCVSGENCWSVIYSDRRVCVLEGSSVDFPCTYFYPSALTVTRKYWFLFQPNVDIKDLSEEKQFSGRVEFIGEKERNCTLRMRNVTKNDSGEYRYEFFIGRTKFFGRPGVMLSVTDLQVRASSSSPSEAQTVTLTCISTCTLPNNPTYIWYKNGEPVTNKPTKYNKLYLDSASPEDVLQYSCALGGPEESTMVTLIAVGMSVFLVLIFLTGWIWLRRRKSSPGKDSKSPGETGQGSMLMPHHTRTIIQAESGPLYGNVSALTTTSSPTKRKTSDGQDGVHYSSIHFKRSQSQNESLPTTSTFPFYPTEDQVQYSAVKFSKESAAPY